MGLSFQEGEWERIVFCKTFLEKFKICTDAIQKDSSTVVDGVKLWLGLIDHVDNLRHLFPCIYENFFNQTKEVIKVRTTKHMSMSSQMEVINFLNPHSKDDSDDLMGIADKLMGMAKYYLQKLGLEENLIASKLSKINAQMAAYVLGVAYGSMLLKKLLCIIGQDRFSEHQNWPVLH